MPDATLQPMKPLPFEEAAAFWKTRVPLTSEQFDRLAAESKKHAFVVAGLTKQSMVEDVFTAMGKAIGQGTTFGQFKKDIRGVIDEMGWQKQGWRLQTIFRTNVQAAYAGGKWRQYESMGKGAEFLQYDAVDDSRTRPTHAALDGKVFPRDSAFWDTWYPPNGFNCRCTTRAMSKAEVKARGLVPEENARAAIDAGADDGAGGTRAILLDRGFATNTAKNVWAGIIAAGDSRGARKLEPVPNLPGPAVFNRPPLVDLDPKTLDPRPTNKMLPEGLTAAEARVEIKKAFGPDGLVDVTGDRILPGSQLAGHLARKKNHVTVIPLLPAVLERPTEVWLTPMTDGVRFLLRKHYIKVWRPEGDEVNGMLIVAEVNGEICTAITMYAANVPNYLEGKRLGNLLYPRVGGKDVRAHRTTMRPQQTWRAQRPGQHPQPEVYEIGGRA